MCFHRSALCLWNILLIRHKQRQATDRGFHNYKGNNELEERDKESNNVYQISLFLNCLLFMLLPLKHMQMPSVHRWQIEAVPPCRILPEVWPHFLYMWLCNFRCMASILTLDTCTWTVVPNTPQTRGFAYWIVELDSRKYSLKPLTSYASGWTVTAPSTWRS